MYLHTYVHIHPQLCALVKVAADWLPWDIRCGDCMHPQSKVMIMPSYIIYTIRRENNWSYIVGETGGAYELFFLVGALILTGLAGERSLFMNIAAAFSGV
mmetsp:Transcript_6502/g.18153  ORF Transcript_6502/g.18153 Transcript_6502/m.18153 type:complete len:100 (+) Transcript_6502:333-632(+)